jgi:hypothetical protein
MIKWRALSFGGLFLAFLWIVLGIPSHGRAAGGTITGVVLDSRETPDHHQALLITIQGPRSVKVDDLRLAVTERWLNGLIDARLPEGWERSAEDKTLSLHGPGVSCPAYLRLDSSVRPPDKMGVEVFEQGDRLFRDKKLTVNFRPPVQTRDDLSSVLRLPRYMVPDDMVTFKPLDPAGTPIGGKWTVAGLEVPYSPEAGDYEFRLPAALEKGAAVSASYTDPFGFRLYDTPALPDISFGPSPAAGPPRLAAATPMVLWGDTVAVTGYFPDLKSRHGLLLNGGPVPDLFSSSSLGLVIGLGDAVKPGVQTLGCDPAAGFADKVELPVTVIDVQGDVDRNKLMRGESTPLRLKVVGTDDPVELHLVNDTPRIISLSGGDDQVVRTSGGADNDARRTVRGLKRGDFNLTYTLTLDAWPKMMSLPSVSIPLESAAFIPENFFDEFMDQLRRTREDFYKAKDRLSEGDPEGPDLLRKSKEAFQRLKDKLAEGVKSGEIGEETNKVATRVIDDYLKEADEALSHPPPVRPAAVATSESGPQPQSTITSTPPSLYARMTDGWLEPTQGVWQDDDIFEDLPGKQLTRLGPGRWRAELKMVVGRPAVAIGIRDKGRDTIRIEGLTNGTTAVPVRFRLKLRDGAGERVVYTQPRSNNEIPIDGPPGAERTFSATILADTGLPPFSDFKISQAGPYTLTAELIRDDGSETGLAVSVEGEAIQTYGPRVRFIPVFFSPPQASGWPEAFAEAAQRLRTKCDKEIPMYYPLDAGGLPTSSEPARTMVVAEPNPGFFARLLSKVGLTAAKSKERQDADNLRAVLAQRLGTETSLNGTDKAVVLLSNDDFDRIWPGGTAEAASLSRKLMVVHLDSEASTVAHELVHTMPFLWSSDQMVQEFHKDYHNRNDHNYGNGLQVMDFHWRRNHISAVMGSAGYLKWITQATYYHLLEEFRQRPDPDQVLVRGYLARNGDRGAGSLSPGYQVQGERGLTAATVPNGGWGLILRDEAGNSLGTFPFAVSWWIPDFEAETDVVSFVERVPDLPETRTAELVGPGGLLDRKTVSQNPPSVQIDPLSTDLGAARRAGRLSLTWKASDPDGDKLLFTVLYSGDDGRNWRVVFYEQEEPRAEIPIYWHPRKVRLRVVASDGWHSRSDEVGLE